MDNEVEEEGEDEAGEEESEEGSAESGSGNLTLVAILLLFYMIRPSVHGRESSPMKTLYHFPRRIL